MIELRFSSVFLQPALQPDASRRAPILRANDDSRSRQTPRERKFCAPSRPWGSAGSALRAVASSFRRTGEVRLKPDATDSRRAQWERDEQASAAGIRSSGRRDASVVGHDDFLHERQA